MNQWFNVSFLDRVIQWLDQDILQIFGLNGLHIQFVLVFLLIASIMFVMKPIMEWLLVKQWFTLLGYSISSILAITFLQMVDRYAMGTESTFLPSYYWSISLLAISSYGAVRVLTGIGRMVMTRVKIRSKKRVA
ncbi:hypothetical protein MUO14_21810 [Halobacillus shinanisalinarum]|uniref:Uncharacterized protein n=1 Tax=Halobacillus shinanisalinarum TaxID=2932258 RepID=A0ABY4GY47_9BACI|nr:hypothetical protein [Halobacillus shinanisalinarum]UOQ93004.1 hypothetical protein MUO14_21810 [Halobacillus shinanisalinarum]